MDEGLGQLFNLAQCGCVALLPCDMFLQGLYFLFLWNFDSFVVEILEETDVLELFRKWFVFIYGPWPAQELANAPDQGFAVGERVEALVVQFSKAEEDKVIYTLQECLDVHVLEYENNHAGDPAKYPR